MRPAEQLALALHRLRQIQADPEFGHLLEEDDRVRVVVEYDEAYGWRVEVGDFDDDGEFWPFSQGGSSDSYDAAVMQALEPVVNELEDEVE
jgi:hypothetical protein